MMQVRTKAMKLSVTWCFPKIAPKNPGKNFAMTPTFIFNWEIWPGLLLLWFQNWQHWYNLWRHQCVREHPPTPHLNNNSSLILHKNIRYTSDNSLWGNFATLPVNLSVTVYFTVPIATCMYVSMNAAGEKCAEQHQTKRVLFHILSLRAFWFSVNSHCGDNK